MCPGARLGRLHQPHEARHTLGGHGREPRGASRPAARLLGDDTTPDDHAIPADDDARWRAGVFYANADDPALVVPKRFGVGWTLSWARPTS